MPAVSPPHAVEELHVLAFDVADNRRRYRLVRLLERYGQRVQESVFEAWLTPQQRSALLERASRLLHPSQDRLVCYALTLAESSRLRTLGASTRTPNPSFFVI